MSKRIVYCADGTWVSSQNEANVYMFYKSLTTTAAQLPFYDDGVGAEGTTIERFLGGAFGIGLWQKVKEGYTATRTCTKPATTSTGSASAGAHTPRGASAA